MDLLTLVQWPAMAVTLAAGWLVASKPPTRRRLGFWTFVISNILWIIWACYADSYALIVLQIGLFVMNVRGMRENAG